DDLDHRDRLRRRHLDAGGTAACAFELPAGTEAHVLRQADAYLAQIFAIAIDTDPIGRQARIGHDEGLLDVGRFYATAAVAGKAGRYLDALIGFAKRGEI